MSHWECFDNILIFRHDQNYLYVEWEGENNHLYRKLVPYEKFKELNNISQVFSIRPIYNKCLDSLTNGVKLICKF